jgi:hypothetical protein
MRDALVEGPTCAQIELIKKEFKGEEDCLYLNVYTPKVGSFFTYKFYHQAQHFSQLLIEKLIISQLFKRFLVFYGMQRFITVFARV